MHCTRPSPDAASLVLAIALSFAPPAASSTLAPATAALATCASQLATAAAQPPGDGVPAELAGGLQASSSDSLPGSVPGSSGAASGPAAEETIRVRVPRVPAFEATVLSMAATVGPAIWLMNDRGAAYDDVAPLAALAGLMAGPAVGYVYGGQPLRGLAGIGIRTLCLGAGACGGASAVVAIVGVLGSDVYDIAMLGRNLDRAAERRAIRMTTRRLQTSRAPVIGISATF